MKIKEIRIVRVRFPERTPKTPARRPGWGASR